MTSALCPVSKGTECVSLETHGALTGGAVSELSLSAAESERGSVYARTAAESARLLAYSGKVRGKVRAPTTHNARERAHFAARREVLGIRCAGGR